MVDDGTVEATIVELPLVLLVDADDVIAEGVIEIDDVDADDARLVELAIVELAEVVEFGGGEYPGAKAPAIKRGSVPKTDWNVGSVVGITWGLGIPEAGSMRHSIILPNAPKSCSKNRTGAALMNASSCASSWIAPTEMLRAVYNDRPDQRE